MTRALLPHRRESETVDLDFAGRRFAVTIGFYPDGRLGEVFTSGVKVGSDLDAILADACVALSLLLQHGVAPAALARSMGRAGDGAVRFARELAHAAGAGHQVLFRHGDV